MTVLLIIWLALVIGYYLFFIICALIDKEEPLYYIKGFYKNNTFIGNLTVLLVSLSGIATLVVIIFAIKRIVERKSGESDKE